MPRKSHLSREDDSFQVLEQESWFDTGLDHLEATATRLYREWAGTPYGEDEYEETESADGSRRD